MDNQTRDDIRTAQILAPIGSLWESRRGSEIRIVDYVKIRGEDEPHVVFGVTETLDASNPPLLMARLVSDFHADVRPGQPRFSRLRD